MGKQGENDIKVKWRCNSRQLPSSERSPQWSYLQKYMIWFCLDSFTRLRLVDFYSSHVLHAIYADSMLNGIPVNY